MPRNPYKFPARSRAAMIAALESVGGHYERFARYPFAWNVKIHSWGDITAAGLSGLEPDGNPFNPAFDKAWQDYAESSDSLFWEVCSNAARYYTDGDYCTWPGDDQGAYEFELHGRSGGWLVLTKWHGRSLRDFSVPDDCAADEFATLSWPEVRQLYRAVMTMEQDLTPAKVLQEFRYHLAYARSNWEAERREAIAQHAATATEAAANARELLAEFRAARKAGGALVNVPAICATLRQAIADRIRLARRERRAAVALAGESVAC